MVDHKSRKRPSCQSWYTEKWLAFLASVDCGDLGLLYAWQGDDDWLAFEGMVLINPYLG